MGQPQVAGGRFHADESSRVAEASAPVRLVGRGRVVVVGELRLTGHPVDADRLAGELLPDLALANVGALELVLVVYLNEVEKLGVMVDRRWGFKDLDSWGC